MLKRVWILFRHWREAKTAFATLAKVYGGGSDQLGGLSEEEIEGLIGWLPEEGTFVEFGTLFGLTAKRIAAAKPKLKIVCVDNFCWNPFGLPSEVHKEFTKKILSNELKSGQIVLKEMSSEEFRVSCDYVPEAVFFDALHQYEPVKREIEWAKAKGVKLISGHDYGNPSAVFGVTQAVEEEFGETHIKTVGMCWRNI